VPADEPSPDVSVFGELRAALENQRDQIAVRLEAVAQAEAALDRLREAFALPLEPPGRPVEHDDGGRRYRSALVGGGYGRSARLSYCGANSAFFSFTFAPFALFALRRRLG
jgi:plasmid stabilization system protein ParE